jgi:hypothetical protein
LPAHHRLLHLLFPGIVPTSFFGQPRPPARFLDLLRAAFLLYL